MTKYPIFPTEFRETEVPLVLLAFAFVCNCACICVGKKEFEHAIHNHEKKGVENQKVKKGTKQMKSKIPNTLLFTRKNRRNCWNLQKRKLRTAQKP